MEKQIVHTTSLFEVDNKFDDPRFMKVRISAMHSGINRNGSAFSVDCIKAAKDTFANIPILAEVESHTDANGNVSMDYTTHAMHIETDAFDSDKERIIYDEKVVGIIPETNDFELIHDDETGNEYVQVSGLIYRDYGNYCADILESRDGKTDVSMEIACEDMSYDAKERCLNVGKMTACGVTLLGEDTMPGMAKAHAEMFSAKTETTQEQLIRIMQELKESLDNYTHSKEGGKTEVDNFEETEVTETVVEETVDEVTEETTTTEDAVTTEETNSEEATPEETPVEEAVVEEATVELSEEIPENPSVEFTAQFGEETKKFSISLNQKLESFYSLVNETYGELDGDYYDVSVFEDEKIIEMYGLFSGKAYRQTYKCKKKNEYQLVGDRCEIFKRYLSQEEIEQLENMKANYSAISEKLEKYESEPKKVEILNSAKYKYVANTKEFAELMENHFDTSIDEVTEKANEILLSYAEKGQLNFAAEPQTTKKNIVGISLPFEAKSESRYGDLFQ